MQTITVQLSNAARARRNKLSQEQSFQARAENSLALRPMVHFQSIGRRMRDGRMFLPIQRAHDGLADALFEQAFDFVHDPARTTMRAVFLGALGMRPFNDMSVRPVEDSVSTFLTSPARIKAASGLFLDGVGRRPDQVE